MTPFVTLALGSYPAASPALNLSTLSGGSHGAGTKGGYDESDWALLSPNGGYGVEKRDGGSQLGWAAVGAGTSYGAFFWDMGVMPPLEWDALDCTDTARANWNDRNATTSIDGPSGGTGWGIRWDSILANRNVQETHVLINLDTGTWQAQGTLADGSLAMQTLSIGSGGLKHLIVNHRGVQDASTFRLEIIKTSGAASYLGLQVAYKLPSVLPQVPRAVFGP